MNARSTWQPALVLRWLAIAAIGVPIAFPLYWMCVIAVSPFGTSRGGMELIPTAVTLDNFLEVVRTRDALRWVSNSAVVATAASIVSLAFGASAGYALSRLRFRGMGLVLILVLVTQMLPSTTLVVPLYGVMRNLGLLNSLPGLTAAHISVVIPLAIWLAKGFFDTIPVDLENAARVDGCSRLGAFYHVALPLAAPGLAAIFVYGFVVSWHEFVFARTLVLSPDFWTAAVGLATFRGEFWTSFEPQLAAAVMFAAPVIVVFLILERRFVTGLTSGGVR